MCGFKRGRARTSSQGMASAEGIHHRASHSENYTADASGAGDTVVLGERNGEDCTEKTQRA